MPKEDIADDRSWSVSTKKSNSITTTPRRILIRLINILIISNDEHQYASCISREFTTLDKDIRTVKAIKNRSEKIGNHHELDLYAVPLIKTSKSWAKIDRFAFGNALRSSHGKHKTILLMGVTGSGKTTLINAMINYVFNVQCDDPFRFQLIQKRQTNRIAVYDIHHEEEFNIPFSLTIVDTPSFVEDTEKNEEITEMIRKLFQDRTDIVALDTIGLVARASLPTMMNAQIQIFDTVSNIFGDSASGHTNFWMTFADRHRPPMLEFLSDYRLLNPAKPFSKVRCTYSKIHCAGFFGHINNQSIIEDYNKRFWSKGIKNLQDFFISLGNLRFKFKDSFAFHSELASRPTDICFLDAGHLDPLDISA